MNKNIIYLLFFSVLSSITLQQCYYDNRDDLYPRPTDTLDTIVTFKDDIQPFISGSCANSSGCHAAGTNNPVLESHDQIVNHLDSIEVRAIKDKTMPPSGPADQKALNDLKKWIDAGAPNN